MKLTRKDFPPGFVFGAATAAYQIEGHDLGGAGPCHWDSFAATPGNVLGAQDGAVACDHYHRWPEDLDLMRAGNFDAYRFSTSWARVMPDGRGAVNAEGLDFYDRLVDGVLERGLKPFATLYHWDLPSALADLGGWTNPDIASWFADFAAVMADRLGDRLAAVATINEPWCVAWLSHFIGHHAPGHRDIRAAARAMHHVLAAHGRALETLRGLGQKNLGIVLNFDYTQPGDGPGDAEAATRWDAIMNRWFIGALTGHGYPDEALEGLGPHMPAGWQDDMTAIAAPLDWLGINYYTRHIVVAQPDTAWPSLGNAEGPLPKNAMGWEIYPDGLHHFLTWLGREYTGALPLYVTENGAPFDDAVQDGRIDDAHRGAYIDAHLQAVHRAIADGADVRGFFYWSLLDNYEWAFGYGPRFGLVHVDYETLQRTPKASYHALAAAIARG